MQVQPPREGALVVKIYFAKRKLVWEILENALKKKIEIQWSDIIGIRARIMEDKPGILEIEVIFLILVSFFFIKFFLNISFIILFYVSFSSESQFDVVRTVFSLTIVLLSLTKVIQCRANTPCGRLVQTLLIIKLKLTGLYCFLLLKFYS